MASWKKVIVSGSQASLAGISGSLLTDGALVYSKGAEGALTSVADVTVTTDGHLDGKFSGSFNLQELGDGNGIASLSYDGNGAATVAVQADSTTGGNIQPVNLTANGVGLDINAIAGTGLEADGSANLQIQDGGIANAKLQTADIRFSGSGISTDASVALGATASINVNADDVTIEVADDVVQLKSGSISVGHLDSDLLVIESEGIASNDNDNTIATVAAIKDYVDAQVGGANLDITGSGDTKVSVDLNDEDLIFAGESGVMSVSASVASGDVTVTTAIVDGGVGAAKLATDSVTTVKIADGNVTNAKLATSGIRFSGSGISTDATVALGATASINLNVDDVTVEVDGDNLQVKDLGIDTAQLAAGAVETAKIEDGNVTNVKLFHDGLMIGDTDISLGTTASTFDGLTLTGAEATGSFTGSFVGDGSGLTGLATTLNVTDGSNPQAIDLQTETLTFAGTANEIEVSTATADTLTIGLPNDVTIAGDLTVLGTRTELNVEDLVVKDRFIYLASGSSGATDGGIIVEGAGDADGKGFGWDQSAGRWGFEQAIASGSNTIDPDAYASAVVTSDTAAFQKVGNIRIDNSTQDIYIYS